MFLTYKHRRFTTQNNELFINLRRKLTNERPRNISTS
jgi:hypothetical protein